MTESQANVRRYISKDRNVLLARADFRPVYADYLEHAAQWVGEPDGLVYTMMRQGLAAAGLYLTCRPLDENTAWTINFPEPPLNIFVSCDASSNRVVGRHFSEHVKAEADTRLIVQAVRRRGEPSMSILSVKGFDILDIFEQYYAQSEQLPVRFFELGETEFFMVMALPDVDEEWVRAISQDDSMAILEEPGTSLIEERPIAFACSCDRPRVLHMIGQIFKGKLDELFGEDETAEVQCPRCGKAYQIERENLSDQDAPPGVE